VALTLAQHEQRELTAPFGERHPGFAPRALRGLLSRAGLSVSFCEVASREGKKPYFEVVLAIADRVPPKHKTG
jgi:ArsR family transcriptional regulator